MIYMILYKKKAILKESDHLLIKIGKDVVNMKRMSVTHEFTKPVEGKKIFSEGDRDLVHLKLKEGETIKEHDSPNHVFIFVASGEVQFIGREESHLVNPETILYMKPYEKHALEAKTDVSLFVMKC